MRPAAVEQALVLFLTTETGVQASTKVPNPRPDKFIRLLRTGGSGINILQSRPMLTVQAWAVTDGDAWDLVCAAWDALDGLPLRDDLPLDLWVAEVDLTEPVNLPDTDSGQPRYQFLAQLSVSLMEAS